MVDVVVTIKDKVEKIINSNLVHNTTGKICGENVPGTGSTTLTSVYMVMVMDSIEVVAGIKVEVTKICIIYNIYLLLLCIICNRLRCHQ